MTKWANLDPWSIDDPAVRRMRDGLALAPTPEPAAALLQMQNLAIPKAPAVQTRRERIAWLVAAIRAAGDNYQKGWAGELRWQLTAAENEDHETETRPPRPDPSL